MGDGRPDGRFSSRIAAAFHVRSRLVPDIITYGAMISAFEKVAEHLN